MEASRPRPVAENVSFQQARADFPTGYATAIVPRPRPTLSPREARVGREPERGGSATQALQVRWIRGEVRWAVQRTAQAAYQP